MTNKCNILILYCVLIISGWIMTSLNVPSDSYLAQTKVPMNIYVQLDLNLLVKAT